MIHDRDQLRLRLMTFNIAGGKRAYSMSDENPYPHLQAIIGIVRDAAPDILVLQEVTDWEFRDGARASALAGIAHTCGFERGCHFDPTLTLRDHLHVGNEIMIDALFADVANWRRGNAVCARPGFVQLADATTPGSPRGVPIFRPPRYEGNRDTEPRNAVLARANCAPVFPYVVGTHLTTLTGERGHNGSSAREREAREVRTMEAGRILGLLRRHVLDREEVVLLMGDFNAEPGEPCIASTLVERGGFELLSGAGVTHRRAHRTVDHILVYPRSRLIDYECWSVDCTASDHNPVIADVTLRSERQAGSGQSLE